MRFYLGTHRLNWLKIINVPLFVSRRTLSKQRTLPRAVGPWALDSGGFSELTMYGEWQTSPQQYACEIKRFSEEIGSLEWAAPQDWMCEPWLLTKTGLSISEHQFRTIDNYLTLSDMGLPVIPVLQGWELNDYLKHVEMYKQSGIDLADIPLVGLGSVCRRQSSNEIGNIVKALAALGIRLHGFGVKLQGLQLYGKFLSSADSMAWSFQARRKAKPFFKDCKTHKNCANCLRFALAWRHSLLKKGLIE